MVSSVIVQLNLSNELNLDAIVFNLSCFSVQCHIDLGERSLNFYLI